jgi:hypothetical protein
MKTYKQFCEDVNIQENWLKDVSNVTRNITNTLGITKPTPKPIRKAQPVLAYKNYQQGFGSGKNWKPGKWSPEQEKRHGWKPVEITGYEPTGNLTAWGKPLTRTSPPSVAVPYASNTSTNPRIPFGTKLTFTNAPMGKKTIKTTATVTDTGSFGRRGDLNSVNQNTFADASPSLQCKLNPKACGDTNKFGKHMAYVLNYSQNKK